MHETHDTFTTNVPQQTDTIAESAQDIHPQEERITIIAGKRGREHRLHKTSRCSKKREIYYNRGTETEKISKQSRHGVLKSRGSNGRRSTFTAFEAN